MIVKWKGLGNRITNGEEKGKNARGKERKGETERTSSSNLSIFIHTTLETHGTNVIFIKTLKASISKI